MLYPGGEATPGTTLFTPRSPRWISVDGHTFWDPGGIIAFPPAHNEPVNVTIFSYSQFEGKGSVHMTDEDQQRESSGAVGLNNRTSGIEKGHSNDQTFKASVNQGSPTAAPGEEDKSFNKAHEAIGSQWAATEGVMTSKEVVSPPGGVVVMPENMSLPVIGDSGVYELGLRPIDCSETKEQLRKAEYVTGILPFQK